MDSREEILRITQELVGTETADLVSIITKSDADAHYARERKSRAAARIATYRAQGARRALAIEFGNRRGWRLSESIFDLETLAKGKVHAGSRNYVDRDFGTHAAFDHPFYYRGSNRRAAAIAAHLYGWPHVKNECDATCKEWGLVLEVPEDYPSWWLPGSTVLVIYTAARDF